MPAISRGRLNQIKVTHLQKTSEVRVAHQSFTRKRRMYLNAVIRNDLAYAKTVEKKVMEQLMASHQWKSMASNPSFQNSVIKWLRKGAPLSNAVHIAQKQVEYEGIKETHLVNNPRFRKPEVLRKELELLELEYQTLKLAFSQASKHKLESTARDIQQQIEVKVRAIAGHRRILEKRLVEG